MESNDLKIQILISALEERYRAQHIIRERTYKFCTWTLGVFLIVGGWFATGNATLDGQISVVLAVSLVIIVMIVRRTFLRDLEIGFNGQMRAAANLEEMLHLYDPAYFGSDKTEIYPPAWRNAGTSQHGGNFFRVNFLLLYVGTAALLISWIVNYLHIK